MNDKQLRAFLKVAESKSLSKAENQLFLTRQAIQKQINSLESELGENLFFSNRSGTVLTPFGEFFYPKARKLLNDHDNLIRECTQHIHNGMSLRIGSPLERTPHIMDILLRDFKNSYPTANVNMQYVSFDDKSSLLEYDALDIVLDFNEKTWDSDVFDFFKLCEEPYKCFVSPDSDLAEKETIYLEDLKDRTVGLWYPGHKDLNRILTTANLNIQIEHVSRNNIMSVMSTCYNDGVFISKTDFFQDDLSLKRIPFDDSFILSIGLIFKNPASISIKNFLKTASECMQSDDNS